MNDICVFISLMYTLNAAFVGKVLRQFDELPSTNDYARFMANEPHTPEGAVVLAGRQTSGRGQMGAVWESAPGENLTLSVIFKPVWLRADQQFQLSKAVALAVYDTVSEAFKDILPAFDLHIKWPNDILLNGKKIAGILIENTISGHHLGISVVGIGLNVNQQQFSPTLPFAGSMAGAVGQSFDTSLLAQRLFFYLENRYLTLRDGDATRLHTDYLRHLLGFSQRLPFESLPDGERFEGTIQGIDEDGKLVVGLDGGQERRFGLKEIKMNWGNV